MLHNKATSRQSDSVDSSVSSECFGSGTCRIAQAHQRNKACEAVEIGALSTYDRPQPTTRNYGQSVNRSRTIPPVGFFNECCNNIGATGDDPAVCQAPLVGDRRRTVRAGSRTCHQGEASHLSYLEALLGAEVEEREPNTVARRVRDAHFPRRWKNSLSPIRGTFPLPRSGTRLRAAICSAASRSFFGETGTGKTTNLPLSEWNTMFPNAGPRKVMLDRLTDQVHLIETGTKSYRFRRALHRKEGGWGFGRRALPKTGYYESTESAIVVPRRCWREVFRYRPRCFRDPLAPRSALRPKRVTLRATPVRADRGAGVDSPGAGPNEKIKRGPNQVDRNTRTYSLPKPISAFRLSSRPLR